MKVTLMTRPVVLGQPGDEIKIGQSFDSLFGNQGTQVVAAKLNIAAPGFTKTKQILVHWTPSSIKLG